MNPNNSDKGNTQNSDGENKYIKRIQFTPLDTDPDAVYEKIRNRIQRDKVAAGGVSPIWKYISVAATLALLIVSSWSVSLLTQKTTEPVTYMEVTSAAGARTKVILPDSTHVWLNSNSFIRYPNRFTAGNRMVEFAGEGLFEVRKDETRPFIVSTGDLRIKVLGTVFNLWAKVNSDIIETTLLEGSVALYKKSNNTNTADLILKPDQQVLFNKVSEQIEVLDIEAASYSAWVTGEFIFEKKTLQEIINTLQRAFDARIQIQHESLKNVRLTARFDHQETLDEILSVLQISAKYKYKRENGIFYIMRK